MRIEWRPLAEQDLKEIVSYIASDSPSAAYDMHKKIGDHVDDLARFPKIGRPGRVEGTRELVIPHTPFIVAYRLSEQAVVILRVLHGARRWPDHL